MTGFDGRMTPGWRRWTAGLAMGMLCLSLGTEIEAQQRDPDGTRMQARRIEVGSTQSESLTPPGDVIDWRYFKLDRSADVAIEVNSQPRSVALRLVLTSATGDEIIAVTTQDGRGNIRRRLDPGIYYLSVSSSQNASYRLSVR